MSFDTVIFLGPSIPYQEARQYYTDAYYHPPAQCGDILRCLRLKPQRILLIDGYFNRVPSVWHKEILYAIELGVEVIGASSMGALRAAECQHFGMKGIGEIFQAYADQLIEDDDEVAVNHGPIERGYVNLSESMVDIRTTLKAAMAQNIIGQPLMDQLIEQCKAQFFLKRRLGHVVANHVKKTASAEIIQLEEWLAAGNFVSQKKRDAISALRYLKNSKPTPARSSLKTANTTLFRRLLIKEACVTPFPQAAEKQLPETEQKTRALLNQFPKSCHALLFALTEVRLYLFLKHHATMLKRMTNLQQCYCDYIRESSETIKPANKSTLNVWLLYHDLPSALPKSLQHQLASYHLDTASILQDFISQQPEHIQWVQKQLLQWFQQQSWIKSKDKAGIKQALSKKGTTMAQLFAIALQDAIVTKPDHSKHARHFTADLFYQQLPINALLPLLEVVTNN